MIARLAGVNALTFRGDHPWRCACPSVRGVVGDLDSLSSAWQVASSELGIGVTAPFGLADGSAMCVAWISGFGSAQGTVIVGRNSPNRTARSIAESQGMHYCEIDEETYSSYDRNLFVATLNDWGWHGDSSAAPGWYTGEPWG